MTDDEITEPGWYYYWTEYPEEGSCGPFGTEAEARADAEAARASDEEEFVTWRLTPDGLMEQKP